MTEFRALRRALGLTPPDAARLFGVTVRTWGNWEQEGWPVPGPAVQLARLLAERPELVQSLARPDPSRSPA